MAPVLAPDKPTVPSPFEPERRVDGAATMAEALVDELAGTVAAAVDAALGRAGVFEPHARDQAMGVAFEALLDDPERLWREPRGSSFDGWVSVTAARAAERGLRTRRSLAAGSCPDARDLGAHGVGAAPEAAIEEHLTACGACRGALLVARAAPGTLSPEAELLAARAPVRMREGRLLPRAAPSVSSLGWADWTLRAVSLTLVVAAIWAVAHRAGWLGGSAPGPAPGAEQARSTEGPAAFEVGEARNAAQDSGEAAIARGTTLSLPVELSAKDQTTGAFLRVHGLGSLWLGPTARVRVAESPSDDPEVWVLSGAVRFRLVQGTTVHVGKALTKAPAGTFGALAFGPGRGRFEATEEGLLIEAGAARHAVAPHGAYAVSAPDL
ncbi:MAG: serine/threonine-protein kinase [Planctomycetota bacterium]|jgi:hypothetical protein